VFLLDTNVVSELRRKRPHGGVLDWLRLQDAGDLYVSAVTFGEIQAGIEEVRPRDPVKAAEIEAWAEEALLHFKILPMDADAFRLWAKLMHRQSDTLSDDAMIAATALRYGLVVATRNVRDFAGFGVATIDPFRAGASE